MHDVVFMEMLYSREHLAHDITSMALRKFGCGNDSVKELSSVAVFHHYVHVPVVDEGLVELDDVRVINL